MIKTYFSIKNKSCFNPLVGYVPIGMWLPWKLGKASTSAAYLTPPASKLKDCMTECLRDDSKGPDCKSIGINSSSSFCNLFNSSASSASSAVYDSLYFNKPAWYLGEFKFSDTLSFTVEPHGICTQITIF